MTDNQVTLEPVARRPYGVADYLEGDRDYVLNNIEWCVAALDAALTPPAPIGGEVERVARAIYGSSCAETDEPQPAWESVSGVTAEAFRNMARAQALEEAAKVVDTFGEWPSRRRWVPRKEVATTIRALNGQGGGV